MALGFSRDEAGKLILLYIELGILKENPFVSVEQKGIGKLMQMTIEGGHKGYADIEDGGEIADLRKKIEKERSGA